MEELPRKERERLGHRREMLEAAERLFSQKGYHGTTMQEIADEAEFSVGALYNMFESKEDLFSQLVEIRVDQYFESVYAKIDAADGPIEKIRTTIATKLAFFRERKDFFRIFCDLGAEEQPIPPPGASKKHIIEKYLEYERKLQSIFQEGIRQGVFVDQDPALVVSCLEGMSNAVIARWIHAGIAEPGDTQPEEIERLFFHGVLAEGNQ